MKITPLAPKTRNGCGEILERGMVRANPLIPSKKKCFALAREGFPLQCLESFRRVQRTEMAWKKIAAANFLPGKSMPWANADHITDADRGSAGV